VTYKIFAKALQIQLQVVLMETIITDQLAFLPMRFILDNIFLTHKTIHHAKPFLQPLMFLKLDFSKAYDRVELFFLFTAMELMGFPARFIQMTKMLFVGGRALVNVNGRYTSYFSVNQGVRQGCPLAPYLFLIIGEVLNHCIKRAASTGCIKGIQLLGSPVQQTIMQFANDTSMTLKGKEEVVLHTVRTL
jgi:hypothetical protein